MGEEKKIRLMTISDNPIGKPTGVGLQTRYMIEGLLKTGKYQVASLAATAANQNMNPIKTQEYGDAWEILPINGFGEPEVLRAALRLKKPDILWFMTDPRYYWWLWNMENEIRTNCYTVYYNIWDNLPYPTYNKKYYESTDTLVAISKLTFDINKTVAPNTECLYLPHAVDPKYFKPLPEESVKTFRKNSLGPNAEKFIFFWNNRNQKRKQAASLIWAYKDFCDKIGHDKTILLMHTDPKEAAGPDLEANVKATGLTNGEVLFSTDKALSFERLGVLYNACDCGINISDSEGFGLSLLETLACGKPAIATLTGGMVEQIINDNGVHLGVGLKPSASPVVGSQIIPYIYEDHVSRERVVEAMTKMYFMSKEERNNLGKLAVEHVNKHFNFEQYTNRWDEILTSVYQKGPTWPRVDYKSWSLTEMKS